MPRRQKETRQERRTEVLLLRKAGYTFDEIATRLGTTHQNVCAIYHRAMDKALNTAVEDMRALENARLDDLLRSIYAAAVKGDLGAVDRCLRIMERRAKLLGLDAPTRTDVTTAGEPLRIEIEYADAADQTPDSA